MTAKHEETFSFVYFRPNPFSRGASVLERGPFVGVKTFLLLLTQKFPFCVEITSRFPLRCRFIRFFIKKLSRQIAGNYRKAKKGIKKAVLGWEVEKNFYVRLPTGMLSSSHSLFLHMFTSSIGFWGTFRWNCSSR